MLQAVLLSTAMNPLRLWQFAYMQKPQCYTHPPFLLSIQAGSQ
jgi:hypothetical protein